MDYIKFIRSKVGHSKVFIPCASVFLINKENKVLVETRADNGMKAFPGGCQELEESNRMTAIREMKEETGLDIKIIKPLGMVERFNFSWPNGDQAHTLTFCYFARLKNEDEIPFIGDKESTKLEWMEIREALKECLPFEGEEVIKLYTEAFENSSFNF